MITMSSMATDTTLLCIHRDPSPLRMLRENGYNVLTATSGVEGLRLFMTCHVDAIVLEYHLGFLDGGVAAAEIKKTRPEVPVLMVIDDLDVPEDALRSVDMVVAKFDGGSLPVVGRTLDFGTESFVAGQSKKKHPQPKLVWRAHCHRAGGSQTDGPPLERPILIGGVAKHS
jgi:CheY-like chemotaxis protein